MVPHTPISTHTATLFPYTTLFRSPSGDNFFLFSPAVRAELVEAPFFFEGVEEKNSPSTSSGRTDLGRESSPLALRARPSRSTDSMSDADPSTQRIISVELDEGSIVWRNPDVEQERRVAIDRKSTRLNSSH